MRSSRRAAHRVHNSSEWPPKRRRLVPSKQLKSHSGGMAASSSGIDVCKGTICAVLYACVLLTMGISTSCFARTALPMTVACDV